MTRRVPMLLAVAVLAFAACSSNAKPAPTTTTTAVSPTTAPSNTTAPTTTTTGLTSSSTTTSTAVTTAVAASAPATSTEPIAVSSPPTPTSTEFGPEESAVRQAMNNYVAAYVACGQSPATCDPSSYLADEGPARAIGAGFVESLIRKGQFFSADARGTYIEPTMVREISPTQIEVDSCWYDALITLGPQSSGGEPTIVDDGIYSNSVTHVLYFDDGRWLVGEERPFTFLGDGNRCPPHSSP